MPKQARTCWRAKNPKEREQHLVTREKQLTAIHDEIKKEACQLELVRKMFKQNSPY